MEQHVLGLRPLLDSPHDLQQDPKPGLEVRGHGQVVVGVGQGGHVAQDGREGMLGEVRKLQSDALLQRERKMLPSDRVSSREKGNICQKRRRQRKKIISRCRICVCEKKLSMTNYVCGVSSIVLCRRLHCHCQQKWQQGHRCHSKNDLLLCVRMHAFCVQVQL